MLTYQELMDNGFNQDVDGINLNIFDMHNLYARPQINGKYIIEFDGEIDLFFRDGNHLKSFISAFNDAEDFMSTLNDENYLKTC